MKKLFVLITASIILAACATTQPETTVGQYCYTDQEIKVQNGEQVFSQTLVNCSDRPKVNHLTRSAGVSDKCRSYTHTIQINGVNRNVKGFLCRFPDGTWEPVNDVYAH